MKKFNSKKVLITGAASGIGKETAILFAKEKANLILVDVNLEGVSALANLLEKTGVSATPYVCDISEPEQVERLANDIHEKFGSLDILINNAGIGVAGRFLNTKLETWTKTMNINFMGAVHFCYYFIPKMIEDKKPAYIVNVSSASAFVPTKEMPIYASSKCALLGFSEALRSDLAQHNIGVSAVCPGLINTPIINNTLIEGEEKSAAKFKKSAIKMYRRRNYPPSKVAEAILKSIQKEKAVYPVSPEAWFMYLTKRFIPMFWYQMTKFKMLNQI